MKTKIFLNLPVKDLKRSMDFFKELDFAFNLNFTNDQGACLVIDENIFAMLLTEDFFKTFTNRQICDTDTTTELITALSVDSREEADTMLAKVIKAGGTEYRETKDYGWMYQRNFLDLDGHHWEIFFMDESQIPSN